MNNFVSSAAYAASQALAAQGLHFKRSHLFETISALLGYGSYAALTADEADPTRQHHLNDAEILVLNVPLGMSRSAEIAPHREESVTTSVVLVCIDALKTCCAHAAIYASIADFYDSHAREALAEAIYNSDDTAYGMAESNASFPNEPEMSIECPATTDLWAAREEWTITADGDMTGEYDADGDRMFNGNILNCRGWITYRKAGRAGLVFADQGGSGGVDDSWRDQDHEVEMEYLKSLNEGKPEA